MKNILITGGTGLIGTRLMQLLQEKGYQTAVLSRQKRSSEQGLHFFWDPKAGFIDPEAIAWAHGIVHLAGANVAEGRWTDARKREIMDSRTLSSEALFKALSKGNHGVKAVVAATGVGWYGDTGKQWMDESRPAGKGFLADVCKEWEQAIGRLSGQARTTMIRVGVVLSPRGGALVEIAKPIRLFAGAPLGSGHQYMSWIHEDDLCRLFMFALEHEEISGVYNGVAPNPITNAELTKAIALQLGKPLVLPNVPSFAMRLMLGEMADIVLEGCRASCQKIEQAGFSFRFTALDEALSDLLKRTE